MGFSFHDPAIQTAIEKGLISREQLGLPASPTPQSQPAAKPTAVPPSGPAGWSITLPLPCRVVSEPNERCHWSVRRRRFREQAEGLWGAWEASPPLRVTFIRIGKRRLDTDNLAAAFKGLRDALAGLLGIDDGDDRIAWEYDQATGEPGVRLTIEGRR
jgi:hypothetical protein